MVGYIKNPIKEQDLKLRYENYKKQTFEEYKKQHNRNMDVALFILLIFYALLICSVAFGILHYGEKKMIERRDSIINSVAEDICNDKGQDYISSKIFIEPDNQLVITCTKENIIKSYYMK